jgi:biofilm PGA synthesis N-glycosyltransferase PgaC
MTRKLAYSVTTGAISISLLIGHFWIQTLYGEIGFFWTWFILLGMVFIPCFGTFFVSASLILPEDLPEISMNQGRVSILIAAYNEEDTIERTLKSIYEQSYNDDFEVILIDDGSTDNTVMHAEDFKAKYSQRHRPMRIIGQNVNVGKANALNFGLAMARHDYIITVDADTRLKYGAIHNIMDKLTVHEMDAVAGSLRVENWDTNFLTKMQFWDYTLGIAAAKEAQSMYDCTLVAQGAFSAYTKQAILDAGGWHNSVGEDIVLSWEILASGGKIGISTDAFAYTNVPETYKDFYKQRKRWSRGLIEAFRNSGRILWQKKDIMPFVWYNLFFPYTDFIYTFVFLPSIIAAIFFNNHLLASGVTLLVIPLGMLLLFPIWFRQKRRSFRPFPASYQSLFAYILVYQLLQMPSTLSGYFSELFKLKKRW